MDSVVDDDPPPRPRRILRYRRYWAPEPPDPLADQADAWLDGPAPEGDDSYPEAEDFIPSPPKPLSPLSRVPAPASFRPALLCFVLFFVASGIYWNTPSRGGWASGEDVFQRGETWRLLTALFTHSDMGHLLSNTPLFLIFGWYLFEFFGAAAFPLGALLIGVLSNAVTVYLYNPSTHLVGASGMLYGMIALWLVLYVHFESVYTVPMRIFRAITVSLVLLFPTTFQENTSYLAHASGFGIGLIVGFGLSRVLRLREPSQQAGASPQPKVVDTPR